MASDIPCPDIGSCDVIEEALHVTNCLTEDMWTEKSQSQSTLSADTASGFSTKHIVALQALERLNRNDTWLFWWSLYINVCILRSEFLKEYNDFSCHSWWNMQFSQDFIDEVTYSDRIGELRYRPIAWHYVSVDCISRDKLHILSNERPHKIRYRLQRKDYGGGHGWPSYVMAE